MASEKVKNHRCRKILLCAEGFFTDHHAPIIIIIYLLSKYAEIMFQFVSKFSCQHDILQGQNDSILRGRNQSINCSKVMVNLWNNIILLWYIRMDWHFDSSNHLAWPRKIIVWLTFNFPLFNTIFFWNRNDFDKRSIIVIRPFWHFDSIFESMRPYLTSSITIK